MKRTGIILAVIFALGIVVGGLGHQRLSAQPESVTRTVLLKTDVAGAEGKEAVIVVAEIAPGATTGKHLHAGQEFAYILEGSLLLTVDGKPAVTYAISTTRPSSRRSAKRRASEAAPGTRVENPSARATPTGARASLT